MEAARTSLNLRHPTSPLPLLPSGPDGIHDWSSRRNRCGPPWSNYRDGGSRADGPCYHMAAAALFCRDAARTRLRALQREALT